MMCRGKRENVLVVVVVVAVLCENFSFINLCIYMFLKLYRRSEKTILSLFLLGS